MSLNSYHVMHPAASSSLYLCSTWIAQVPCTLHNTHKVSSAVTMSQAGIDAVRESVAATHQKILPPPFTGVGTLSHSSTCRCLFTPREYYVREKLQLSNHNAQCACGREYQLLWTARWRQHYLVGCGDWLAHGIDASLGQGDRWTDLVCVVQCARYQHC